MVSGGEDNPLRLFAAAWETAAGVVAEWAEQTAAQRGKRFISWPAIRPFARHWRAGASPLVWTRQDCDCSCATAHPDDIEVYDNHAVITSRLITR